MREWGKWYAAEIRAKVFLFGIDRIEIIFENYREHLRGENKWNCKSW